MNYRFLVLAGALMLNSPHVVSQSNVQTTKNVAAPSLFNGPNDDAYWEALVQVAQGNKETALQIAASIKNGTAVACDYPWKENNHKNIHDVFNRLLIHSLHNDPQNLTRLRLFESIGLKNHNAHLNDISAQALLRNLEEAKADLQTLNNFLADHLSPDQKISHKIFSWSLQHAIEGEHFLFHDYQISQLSGFILNVSALLTEYHTLETEEDVENYIARLNKIPQHFQQGLEFIELQKNKGIIPPRFALEKVLITIKKLSPDSLEKNIFYTHLEAKLKTLPLHDRDALLKKTHTVLADAVYPAFEKATNYFTQLLENAHSNNGVWALPNGEAYYSYMLRYHTTTDLTADEIYELGLQEVAKIHKEMRKILADEKIVDESKNVGALVQELSKNLHFYYPNTKDGKRECLADYTKIIERTRKELAHLFDLKPHAGVVVQQVPAHEEEGAPFAYYSAPSFDGSRPGVFSVNLYDMQANPKYSMETLAIHEAEPGHHFQLALQNEMNIPMLRKIGGYTAYCEGWALYAEKLAYENSFYSSSFAKLGHLQDELLRAARLVIDTGIHHKRWSREQAITYMEEVTGYHHDRAASEVERYFVLPGQACSYKIGQLKILALRKQAHDALREKFDIREFHNEVLKIAAVPLTVLEEAIAEYIQRKRAA